MTTDPGRGRPEAADTPVITARDLIHGAPSPAAEVGGEVRTEVERRPDHTLVRLDGPLSRSTAPRVGTAVVHLLAEGRPVLADVSRLRLGRAAAVEVFPMALHGGGGWPVARLVLFGADADLTAALQAARVPEHVPLAADHRAATEQMHRRPEVVHRQFHLLNRPASGRFARHAADTACRDWDIPHVASDLALIADELVINVVEHTDSTAALTLSLRGADVTVSVRDDLPRSSPRPQLSCVGRPCGRGLQVVTALATRWGVTQHADGKTVWASLSTAPSAARPRHDGDRVPSVDAHRRRVAGGVARAGGRAPSPLPGGR